MIRAGDILENPVTGERLRFLKTSRDTGGEAVVVEATVQPRGAVGAAHVHPYQVEQYRIVAGVVGFCVGHEKREARAGDVVVVERGTPHNFWNAGAEPARFIAVVRPALEFEGSIETSLSLATEGTTHETGRPNCVESSSAPRRAAATSRSRSERFRSSTVDALALCRSALCGGTPSTAAGPRGGRAGAASAAT